MLYTLTELGNKENKQEQEKFLNIDRVKEIVNNAPDGTNKRDVIQGLLDRGYALEGFEDAEKTFKSYTEKETKKEKKDIKDKSSLRTAYDIGTAPIKGLGKGLQAIGSFLKPDFLEIEEGEFEEYMNTQPENLGDAFKQNLDAMGFAGRTIANTPGDAVELLGEFVELLGSPIETVETLKPLGKGINDKRKGIETDESKMVDLIAEEVGQTITDPDKLFTMIANNPIDTLTIVNPKAGIKVTNNLNKATWGGLKKVETKIGNLKKGRTKDDIVANILQPYKGMTEKLDDAKKGMDIVLKDMKTKDFKNMEFQELLYKSKETLNKVGEELGAELKKIKGRTKDSVLGSALDQLENVYEGVTSKKMMQTKEEISKLKKIYNEKGLTAEQTNKLKILHTKSNGIFNEKGFETKGFIKDDLRAVRIDIKNIVEDMANKSDVDIKNINKQWGEVWDTQSLLQNQSANVASFRGRQLPETFSTKLSNIITQAPIIKQIFTDPLRGIFTGIGMSMRGDKINPLEVQKRLPKLLKEFKKAGMKESNLQKIENLVNEEIINKLGKPLSERLKTTIKKEGQNIRKK